MSKENKNTIIDILHFIVDFIAVIGLIVGCYFLFTFLNKKDSKYNNSPVEETINIDSVIRVKDSVTIVIKEINNIKDAEVIKVRSLDNDSTLKLFYKLVSEE